MKKRVRKVYCDTEKDGLAHRAELGGETNQVVEAYVHRKKQFFYIYVYNEMNGERKNEKIVPKTMDEINRYLEFVNSPSRFFSTKKEYDEYIKEVEDEIADTEPLNINQLRESNEKIKQNA